MNINLSPYNWYIFYGALALLIVFVILTAVHAIPLVKDLKAHQPEIDNIKKNVQLTQIKTGALKEKQAESKKNDKTLNSLLLLWAIHKSYKAKDERGPRAYVNTAAEVLQKRKARADLFSSLRNGI